MIQKVYNKFSKNYHKFLEVLRSQIFILFFQTKKKLRFVKL